MSLKPVSFDQQALRKFDLAQYLTVARSLDRDHLLRLELGHVRLGGFDDETLYGAGVHVGGVLGQQLHSVAQQRRLLRRAEFAGHLDELAFILGVRGNSIGAVFLQQIAGLHSGEWRGRGLRHRSGAASATEQAEDQNEQGRKGDETYHGMILRFEPAGLRDTC